MLKALTRGAHQGRLLLAFELLAELQGTLLGTHTLNEAWTCPGKELLEGTEGDQSRLKESADRNLMKLSKSMSKVLPVRWSNLAQNDGLGMRCLGGRGTERDLRGRVNSNLHENQQCS